MNASEYLLATIVEQILQRDEGRHLGNRTEHDHNDGVRLAIDLTYDEATPPVAMELTSVQDDSYLGTVSFVRKAADRLTRLARAERLGGWEVVVSEGNLANLEVTVADLIRSGREIDVTHYTSDDLIRWERTGELHAEMALRQRLKASNVAQIRRLGSGHHVAISTWGESKGSFGGILDLGAVIEANIAKIAAAAREGHLVVGVGRFRTSEDPSLTPVPSLPTGLDRLWLVRLWTSPDVGYRVWSATPERDRWLVHEPLRLP